MIEGELVATIRELADRGIGSEAIARTVGLSRITVRRYLRQPIARRALSYFRRLFVNASQ